MLLLVIAVATAATWLTASATVIQTDFRQTLDFAVIKGQDKAIGVGNIAAAGAAPRLLNSLPNQIDFAADHQSAPGDPITAADAVVPMGRGAAVPAVEIGVSGIPDINDFDLVGSIGGALSVSAAIDRLANGVPAAEPWRLSAASGTPIGEEGQSSRFAPSGEEGHSSWLATTVLPAANNDARSGGGIAFGGGNWSLQPGSGADPAQLADDRQATRNAPAEWSGDDSLGPSAPDADTPGASRRNRQPDPVLIMVRRLLEFAAFLHTVWPLMLVVVLAGGGPIGFALVLRRPQRP